jgi:hypothetical protein
MSRQIRPSTPADGAAIAALVVEAGLNPNVEPEQQHWKYWEERSDWPGSRSYVMTSGSEIIAHAGIVPGVCSTATRRLRMIHMIDWAARPGSVGAGVTLMKQIRRLTDALLAVGGSQWTQQIIPHLGFTRWGIVTEYISGLYPLRQQWRDARPLWKLPPRLARGLAWSMWVSLGCGSWQVERVGPGDLRRVQAVLPRPRRDTAIFERTDSLFRYMLSCPISPMELHALTQRGKPHGYFLLAHAPGHARLVDCWLESDDPADWRALVRCAQRQATLNPDARYLTTQASDPLLSRCLVECGFEAQNEIPVQVLAEDTTGLFTGTLRAQMLDYDAAFLYHPPRPAARPVNRQRDDAPTVGLAPQV